MGAFAHPEGLLDEADVLPAARGETRGEIPEDEPNRLFTQILATLSPQSHVWTGWVANPGL